MKKLKTTRNDAAEFYLPCIYLEVEHKQSP